MSVSLTVTYATQLGSREQQYLEKTGFVATAQCCLPQPATHEFTVVEADKAVRRAHVFVPFVHFLSRLKIHKKPA